jgi:hypothetical protein
LNLSGLPPLLLKEGRAVAGRNQNWREAVRFVNRAADDSAAPIFVRSGLIESDRLQEQAAAGSFREYCLLPVKSIYRLQVGDGRIVPLSLYAAGELRPEQWERMAAAGEAWFLLSGSERTVDQILGELRRSWPHDGRPLRVAARRSFGSVSVVRIRVGGPRGTG